MRVTAYLLMFLSLNLSAQISGKVQSTEGDPLPFVNIILLQSSDSSLVKGSLSDAEGNFLIEGASSGQYILSVGMLGYDTWYSASFQIRGSESVMKFNRVTLRESTAMLDEISVSAKREVVENTIEGTTINLSSSMMTNGSNALEVVQRSPGVVIDPRTNGITLNGQSGVLVMINGRPVRMEDAEVMNLLKGMSADNLEKIELLTSPSAKYDADGSAGIINLVMKKGESQGTHGNIALTAGYGWRSKEAVNANVNHQIGKHSIYGSYALNHDNSLDGWSAVGLSTQSIFGGQTDWEFVNEGRRNQLSHSLTGGVDSRISESLTLGVNGIYNKSQVTSNVANNGSYWFANGEFLNALINVKGDGVTDNLSTAAFLEKKLNDKTTLSIDADYLMYHNQSPTAVQSEYLNAMGEPTEPDNDIYVNGNRGLSDTRVDVNVIKSDFERQFTDQLHLAFGIKGAYSLTRNDAYIEQLRDDQWVLDDRNVSNLKIVEKIGAAYTSAQYDHDSITSLTVGLRYEYWDRDFNDSRPDRSFGKLFPSVFYSRVINDKQTLQGSYNKRISRPSYNDLTNFLSYNDPASVFTGNPLLNPTITHNLKMSLLSGARTFSLVYMLEENPIARFQIVESENRDLSYITPQNLDYQRTYSFQMHWPVNITDWWSINMGGSAGIRAFAVTHTKVPAKKTYFLFNTHLNQNFTLPKKMSVELSGFYNGDQYNGSTFINGFGMLNMGVKKELEQNRGTLQLTVTDLLQSMVIKPEVGRLTEEAFGARGKVVYRPESARHRIFKFTYTRSFGSQYDSKPNRRGASAEEERSRLKTD